MFCDCHSMPEDSQMDEDNSTHSVLVGYILWIFGFIGAHRF